MSESVLRPAPDTAMAPSRTCEIYTLGSRLFARMPLTTSWSVFSNMVPLSHYAYRRLARSGDVQGPVLSLRRADRDTLPSAPTCERRGTTWDGVDGRQS